MMNGLQTWHKSLEKATTLVLLEAHKKHYSILAIDQAVLCQIQVQIQFLQFLKLSFWTSYLTSLKSRLLILKYINIVH